MTLDEYRCTGCCQLKPVSEFVKSKRIKRGFLSRCKGCNAAKSRNEYDKYKPKYGPLREDYRKQNWDKVKQQTYARRDPAKHIARQAVNNAIKAGKFSKQPCNECGEVEVDFHHTNGYDEANWFTGMWLCRKHHASLHRKLREEARHVE